MIGTLEALDHVLTSLLRLCLWLHVAWVLLLLIYTLAVAQPARPRPRTVPVVYHVSKAGDDARTCVQAQNPATAKRTVNAGPRLSRRWGYAQYR